MRRWIISCDLRRMLLEQSRSTMIAISPAIEMFCYFAINWPPVWLTNEAPKQVSDPAQNFEAFRVVMVALFKWITYVVCSHPLDWMGQRLRTHASSRPVCLQWLVVGGHSFAAAAALPINHIVSILHNRRRRKKTNFLVDGRRSWKDQRIALDFGIKSQAGD